MAHTRARSFARLVGLALSLSLVPACGESHGAPDLVDSGTPLGDAGADAYVPPIDAGGTDAFVPLGDAGADGGAMPSSCAAQDASETICPASLCDGLDSYAWDGERCVRIDCGACTGTDCGSLVHSQPECEAAHATCVPEMCRATGGEWLFWAAECQHYVCGEPTPADCLVGRPVCDCGNGRSFDETRGGCFEDPTCPVVDPLPPQTLCTSTGGTWTTGICCPTRCGQLCPEACVADACTCGDLQVFDPVRGCIDDAACHVHASGEVCNTQVRCQDGLICCEHCGGAGCDPVMTCQAAVCDGGPYVDTCGNNLFAP